MIGRNRFAMVEPEDTWLTRFRKRVFYRRVPSFPRSVQIQTRTGCNADCVWCPYGESFPTQPMGIMEDALFERIVDECARHRVRRLSPYLMNEPFMDPRMADKIRFMDENCPSAKVVVTTNGSRLFPALVDEILDLGPALHSLYISVQGIEKQGYEGTMRGGMKFEQTMENVHHLLAEKKRRRASYPRIWISMVESGLVDTAPAVRYWRERGARSKSTPLENRGGNIAVTDAMAVGIMEPFADCTRLMKQAYVLFNGDMVVCCADYSRHMVLGNMRDSSIVDVWNGEQARDYRRAYMEKRFDELALCSACEVDSARQPEMALWQDAPGINP